MANDSVWLKEGKLLDGSGVGIPPSALTEGLFVRKTADEPLPSSIVLQNDDHLFLTLAANAIYILTGMLIYDASITGDFKLAFVVPTGTFINWTAAAFRIADASSSGGGSPTVQTGSGTTKNMGGIGAGSKAAAVLNGLIRVGTTPGNLQTQWAQDVSDAVATTVYTDSFLRLIKVV